MDLNRITDKEMALLEEAHLFSIKTDGAGKWWAVPSDDLPKAIIPTYDFDWSDWTYKPRSPLPDCVLDA